jgi:hypothetical protein
MLNKNFKSSFIATFLLITILNVFNASAQSNTDDAGSVHGYFQIDAQ